MNQKELCNKIGMADRTFRRLSPRKRQQWQALAAKGRTAAWYDLLAQLMFEVDSYNARSDYEWFWLQIDGTSVGVKLTRFHIAAATPTAHIDCCAVDQLTAALQYVQSLSK